VAPAPTLIPALTEAPTFVVPLTNAFFVVAVPLAGNTAATDAVPLPDAPAAVDIFPVPELLAFPEAETGLPNVPTMEGFGFVNTIVWAITQLPLAVQSIVTLVFPLPISQLAPPLSQWVY
jgi:hypothetical protein